MSDESRQPNAWLARVGAGARLDDFSVCIRGDGGSYAAIEEGDGFLVVDELNLRLLNELIVGTGVSRSRKSSLAFLALRLFAMPRAFGYTPFPEPHRFCISSMCRRAARRARIPAPGTRGKPGMGNNSKVVMNG